MAQESIVYGCIRDVLFGAEPEQVRARRAVNRRVLTALPSVEEWPLLSREMFALPVEAVVLDSLHTDVVPFGSSYQGVEYEWEQWIGRFEVLLQQMYWVSATVHLETEYSGTHTFTWHATEDFHVPNSGPLAMRCEWVREGVGF
jgi:hypothetical protein